MTHWQISRSDVYLINSCHSVHILPAILQALPGPYSEKTRTSKFHGANPSRPNHSTCVCYETCAAFRYQRHAMYLYFKHSPDLYSMFPLHCKSSVELLGVPGAWAPAVTRWSLSHVIRFQPVAEVPPNIRSCCKSLISLLTHQHFRVLLSFVLTVRPP